jgi:pSer/pThr/pTyr-binding forkhead associated (FHA) protein
MNITLILFKKNGSQKTFSLPSNITVIGRRQDCDLCIPLKSVSRRHCQLNANSDTLKIRDLESHNGTHLNGKRIEEATAKAGDYLKIGPLTFLIQIDGNPEKIVPPPSEKPATEEELDSTALPPGELEDDLLADEGSFAELQIDESDSDLTELEDLENL